MVRRTVAPVVLLAMILAVGVLAVSVVSEGTLPVEAISPPSSASQAAVTPGPSQSSALASSNPAGPSASGAGPSTNPSASPSAPIGILAVPPVALPLDPALASRLQAVLDKRVSAAGIPGASVSIVFPDGQVWTGVSGLAIVGKKTPVTPTTEFAVGSMSKTFLSALILRLVQQGKLSLGQRAAPLLPGISIRKTVTIRMLLDHTSGVADFFFGPGVDTALNRNRAAVWTVARSLHYVEEPYFNPGKGWHYSNTNYLLLGLIAQKVGKASVASQLRRAFFQPLGLAYTYVQRAQKPTGPVSMGYTFRSSKANAKPFAVTDHSAVMPFTSVVTAAGAAGNIASTSADLARWARALYGGQVLHPASLTAAIADVQRTARFHPSVSYGLGVMQTTLAGQYAYGHSGQLLGYRGELRYLPGSNVAIAIVTNQSRTGVGAIVSALLNIVLPIPTPTPTPTPTPSVSPAAPAEPTPSPSVTPGS